MAAGGIPQSWITWIGVLMIMGSMMTLNSVFQDTPVVMISLREELDTTQSRVRQIQSDVRDLTDLVKGHIAESSQASSRRETSYSSAAPEPETEAESPAPTPPTQGMRDPELILIDLGANCGNSHKALSQFLTDAGKPTYKRSYLWEVNPQLVRAYLNPLSAADKSVTIVPHPAWDKDEEMEFVMDKRDSDMSDEELVNRYPCNTKRINTKNTPADSSSLVVQTGKRAGEKIKVMALNLVTWFKKQDFQPGDEIIMKVDIEGAECKVLNNWMDAGMTCNIREYKVEWHPPGQDGCIEVAKNRLAKEIEKCEATSYKTWRR